MVRFINMLPNNKASIAGRYQTTRAVKSTNDLLRRALLFEMKVGMIP